MMDSLVLLSRRRRRHRRGGGDGGDKGETENEQLTTTMLLILSVESRKEKILKVPKHSYVLLEGPKKLEILKIPHKNIDTKRFVSNISRTRIRHGICKRMGVSPERQRQGRTSMVRGRFGVGFRFFFRVK